MLLIVLPLLAIVAQTGTLLPGGDIPSRPPRSAEKELRADCGDWGSRTIIIGEAGLGLPKGRAKALRVMSSHGDVADETSMARLNAGLAELTAVRG
jgi:hypothetical protein